MKLLKILVMSVFGIKKVETKPIDEVTLKLTRSELEALIIGLGEATFKGKQVESVFRLAVKLQAELDNLNK
jgi:hypothetical protein